MKIIYLGNFQNKSSDTTEKHIRKALQDLGHEVISINERDFDNLDKNVDIGDNVPKERPDVRILNAQKDADLFLFHKGEIGYDMLTKLLTYITCPKVCWYFDKVFPDREDYMDLVSSYCEHVFITDDTFIRRHKYKNISLLRQGTGNSAIKGKYKKEYDYDVVFTGTIYDGRQEFERVLGEKYGKRFKMFREVFNEDLYDLCASAKVVVAPEFPCDEFYWSSRFYITLGSGGFLVHPDCYGLRDEFKEGKHFAGYKGLREMLKTIDYYLENPAERKAIQEAGFNHCNSEYTYKHRVEELLKKICQKEKLQKQ